MTDILDPAADLVLRYRSRAQDVIPPVSGVPVLSPAQRRMWVLERLRPGTGEYAASTALRLAGPLDVPALRAALDGLAERHEVLRTRYPDTGGEPAAVVDAPGPVPLRRADLRHAADLPRAVADQVAADRRALDLAGGPVFRAALLAVGPDAHVLVLTTHHIATDAWSEALLLDELRRGYAGARIAAPRTRYADVAAWQRERLTAPSIDRGLAHWRERLAGARPLDLPTDRPRSAVRDGAGDAVGFTVPAEVAAGLRALAAEHRGTPFMALLAGFHALLARHAGHGDISVGVPVANRGRPEVRDVVGLFLNTLVMRAEVGESSFAELLDQVREVALDAFTHQEVPFELVVDALGVERDPSRTPLFSAMFVMRDALPGASAGAAGVEFAPLAVGDTSAKTDLALSIAERADGSLEGAVVYATALFDRSTARRFAERYTRLLSAAVADPGTSVRALDLLGEAERHTVLDMNDTVVSWPNGTVVDLFDAQASATPDAVAVRFGEVEVSYAELDERANRIAQRLRGMGAAAESVVGVCLDRGPDLVAAVLGVLKSGAAYLPLDPDLPPARLALLARGSAVVVDRDRDLPCSAVLHVADDLSGELITPPAPKPAPGSAAYVLHTSGSTGEPKGVVVEHRALVNRLRWAREAHGITAADRVLHKTPIGFDVSLWELLLPLTAGASVVVAEPGAHRDPAELTRLIAGQAVTVLHFVPSVLRAFLAEPGAPLPTVRLLVCSGEALAPDLVAAAHGRLDAEVHNLYGPTEAAIDVTAARCVPGLPVTIGRPIANTRAHVVDAELRPVPVGVAGELVLGGVQLARGYRGAPAATAAAFVPDPFEPGARLYRTGDLARLRADGEIEHLGRVDRQVKIGGHRVEPGEVETAITAHPAVTAAAVTVHSGRLVAHVVPADVDPAVLREHLRGLLPDAVVPGLWRGRDALPLTPSGKTDHSALAAENTRPLLADTHVAPRDARERTVAAAFAVAIGLDVGEVGAHARFFHIGGDSLRAIRVVGALRAEGFDLVVHDVFTHQSAAELAALAGRRDAAEPDGAVAPFALIEDYDRELVPDGVLDAYPMAETQAGMVYEMLANPHATYQNVSCYRVRDGAPFDFAAFRAAVAALVERHEVLRTSFDLTAYSEAMQLVHATAELSAGHTDLRGLDAAEQRARLREHLLAERSALFDVTVPGLVRHHVHEVGDGEWWLTHTECHAVLDGWSQTSVVAELTDLYRRFRAGESAPHTPPAVRFADFVALERAALDSAADRDFWAGVLESHEKLELPAAWAGEDGEPVVVTVPYADLEPRLRALASAAGASLKSVLHAAHLAALAAVCGVRTFRSGLVVNGRPEVARADEVAGMHLNTVPFAADVTAPTWRELVAGVFATETALLPHRRYPMPAMQREWGSSAPLVDAVFVHLDFHVMDWGSTVDLLDDFSPSELALATITFPGYLHVDGRPGRVRRELVELVARAVRHALESMADDGQAHPALAPADREAALAVGGRAEPEDVDGPLLPEIIAAVAGGAPQAPALVRGDEVISYAGLDKAANRVAHRLLALGVGRDDVVGVLLPRGPEQVVAQLAVLKAGAAFLPLDPELPESRLRHMVADAGAAVVLGEPAAGIAAEPVAGHLDLPDTAPPVAIAPESLAYVIYTSGSTGAPKGVAVPHRALRNLIRHARPHWDAGPGDVVVQFASPSYDVVVWETVMALTTGAALALPLESADPGDLRVQAPTATHLTVPPAVLGLLDPADFPRLRLLVSAGEALPGSEAARWSGHTRVVNAYGPTEAAVCATAGEVPAGSTEAWPSIGAPLPGLRAYVLDPDGEPVPWGARGELHLGGASLARGYLNRPGLTADRFLPDPHAAEPGARMYRTGDVVSWTEEGTLRYHGRRDHQVKVRGFRIELTEVEHALAEHPSVESAAVTVHRPGTPEATLVAHAVAATTPAELREHLRSRLPKHMVPTHYSIVDAFPLTPSGKVDRAKLPAPQGLPTAAAEYAPPRTDLEAALVRAWESALHLDRVGVHDDFFDLGGHSLSMMRVITKIRETEGIELTFRTFLENPTIARQVADLDAHAAPRALMWLRRDGERAPLFCVHPGGGSAHWYQRFLPHIDEDVPVAAFEWPELHDDAELPSVEDMAGRHYAELREARPHGPYRLFAWCGGSTIAAELAARLVHEGEQVTFILLDPVLDAVTRTNAVPQLEKLRRLEYLVKLIAREGDPADTPENRAEILALYDDTSTDIDEDLGMDLPERGVGTAWPRTVRIWRETMEAIVLYPHRPFPGRLTLIASDALANGEHVVVHGQTFPEYVARWNELASDGVDVHRVPGDHGGVMKPPLVGTMCGVVNAAIRAAEESERG
jgi:amino acid adenylation domain-containing protein